MHVFVMVSIQNKSPVDKSLTVIKLLSTRLLFCMFTIIQTSDVFTDYMLEILHFSFKDYFFYRKLYKISSLLFVIHVHVYLFVSTHSCF